MSFVPRTPIIMTGRPDFTSGDSMLADQLLSISEPYRHEAGVDRLFLPYPIGVKLSDYWVGNTINSGFWAFVSKRQYQYGWFWLEARLATMCATVQYFGQELGAGWPTITVLFFIQAVRAYFSAGPFGLSTEVTMHLPATYDTALNRYAIKINRNNALLWIEGRLRAVIVFGTQVDALIPIYNNVAPYGITYSYLGAGSGPLMVGMEGTVPIQWTIYHNGLVATDGSPIFPLQLPLYTENTETVWDDLVINAGSVTSHPFPTGGYDKKTIYFQADHDGTLQIQVYLIDAWRVVKNIHALADDLVIQALNIEAPIARCVFTPDAYPTTITEAVASMS